MLGFHCCMGLSLVVVSEGYFSCGAQASHCGGFSCRRAQALVHTGFSSCSMDSVAVVTDLAAA